MRYILELGNRVIRTWWFWAFVLLVIPNCTLDSRGTGCLLDDLQCICNDNPNDPKCPPPDCDENIPGDCKPPCPDEGNPDCIDPPPVCPDMNNPACPPVNAFDPGPLPNSEAIMCEFPTPVDPLKVNGDCATANEIADPLNVRLQEAATALFDGRHSSIALDFSASAIAACGGPRRVTYLDGVFPDGSQLCLNCGTQIMNPQPKYATMDKACVAKCEDLLNATSGFKPANINDYCMTNAHTATNHDKQVCYQGACTPAGMPDMSWFDPRRNPEKVLWIDKIGTSYDAAMDFLQRDTATSGMNLVDWTAGAASAQVITKGDAWVEFDVTDAGVAHALGVRESRDAADLPCEDPINCQDMTPSLDDIGFGLDLNHLGEIYVVESGPPLNFPGPFPGGYSANQRFRVKVKDNNDGTATISYVKIALPCNPGTACGESLITESAAHPRYPLRVDVSFREQFANVHNVTIMRIR